MENYLKYSDEKLLSVYTKLKSDLDTEETHVNGSDLAIKVYKKFIYNIEIELTNRNINY